MWPHWITVAVTGILLVVTTVVLVPFAAVELRELWKRN